MLYSPTIGEFFVVIFRSRMLCPAFSGASPRIYPVTDSPGRLLHGDQCLRSAAASGNLELGDSPGIPSPRAAFAGETGSVPVFVCFGGAVWGAGARF